VQWTVAYTFHILTHLIPPADLEGKLSIAETEVLDPGVYMPGPATHPCTPNKEAR
jgi:hypothetical protein